MRSTMADVRQNAQRQATRRNAQRSKEQARLGDERGRAAAPCARVRSTASSVPRREEPVRARLGRLRISEGAVGLSASGPRRRRARAHIDASPVAKTRPSRSSFHHRCREEECAPKLSFDGRWKLALCTTSASWWPARGWWPASRICTTRAEEERAAPKCEHGDLLTAADRMLARAALQQR